MGPFTPGFPAAMHAPAQTSKPRTWRGTPHYFRAEQAEGWITAYNTTGGQRALELLLRHVEPLVKSILEYRCTTRYESIDELLSRIRIKLWRSLRLYDAERGTAFSFCAKIIVDRLVDRR